MSFQIIRNDITKVYAEAIVNTANPEPVIGGGTDSAIYEAAGAKELLAEREKIGEIKPGDAKATPAFKLDAEYIIHTVGPIWEGGGANEYEILASCYRNSLNLAKELGCTSVAFPLISTGTYEFPRETALDIAIREIKTFLDNTEDMEVFLVVFDRDSFVLSGQLFDGVDAFIDENYVEEKMQSEYMDEEEGHSRSLKLFGSSADRRGNRFLSNIFHAQESEPVSKDGEAPSAKGKKAKKTASRKDEKAESAEDLFYVSDSDISEDVCYEASECRGSLPDGDEESFRYRSAERSLDDVMSHIGETWQESLLRMIDEKGFTDTEVYKKANIDRKLFSKIRSNPNYQPKKITAVAFALALELNLDEAKDFLGRAGYAFSPSNRFDLIVEYFIQNGIHDAYTINLALFDHDQPLIGA